MSAVETIVVTDSRLPMDRFIMEGIDPDKPLFSISEIAKVFFGRGPHWARWRDKSGDFQFEGERVGRRTDSNARYYTLADIEKIAHGLADEKHITAADLHNALVIVQAIARQWGHIS